MKALSKIAHEHDALLVVDVCQSAGALNIDVKQEGVDFLTTSYYKWLLGPSGAGFMYVRKDLVEKVEPVFLGWASVDHKVFETLNLWNNYELILSGSARRFETGSISILSYVGATAALKLIIKAGIREIEQHITGLTGYLIRRLRDEGFELQTPDAAEYHSGIVNFITDDPGEKAVKLREKGIAVSARMNGVRVSPHFYNTEEELERLISEVKKP